MGQPGLGAGLPTWEPSGGGRARGKPFPAEGIRDSANWKGLELREQEGGGDYLRSRLPGREGRLPGGVLPGAALGAPGALGVGPGVADPLSWERRSLAWAGWGWGRCSGFWIGQ